MLRKTNRTIGPQRKLQKLLPRVALTNIYKSFVRPNIHYGDFPLPWKFEFIQHSSSLAITGTIRCISKENLYQEFGLKPFQL